MGNLGLMLRNAFQKSGYFLVFGEVEDGFSSETDKKSMFVKLRVSRLSNGEVDLRSLVNDIYFILDNDSDFDETIAYLESSLHKNFSVLGI